MLADDQQDVGSASERQDGKRVVGDLLNLSKFKKT